MSELTPPIVQAQMLIRNPVAEVFAAFVDPAITTNFWFTHGSDRLQPGHTVEWRWGMYDVSAQVNVLAVEENRRILIEWDDPLCPVEWHFTPHGDRATLVVITNQGFQGTAEEVVAQAIDAMGGFTLVLAGLKAWLEHGIALNLIADHFPG